MKKKLFYIISFLIIGTIILLGTKVTAATLAEIIVIKKVDEEGNPLEGAEFEVYEINNIVYNYTCTKNEQLCNNWGWSDQDVVSKPRSFRYDNKIYITDFLIENGSIDYFLVLELDKIVLKSGEKLSIIAGKTTTLGVDNVILESVENFENYINVANYSDSKEWLSLIDWEKSISNIYYTKKLFSMMNESIENFIADIIDNKIEKKDVIGHYNIFKNGQIVTHPFQIMRKTSYFSDSRTNKEGIIKSLILPDFAIANLNERVLPVTGSFGSEENDYLHLYGNYILREIKTPKGYMKSQEDYRFHVEDFKEHETIITIKNEKIKKEDLTTPNSDEKKEKNVIKQIVDVPSTNATSIIVIILGFISLIIASLIYYFKLSDRAITKNE